MTKVTHTHRGHCQFCLRVHAIDVNTGLLAKHGYTVDRGYFNGECPGSGHLSLHVERTHTDAVIQMYRSRAADATAVADAYEAGTAHPRKAWKGWKTYKNEDGSTGGYFSGEYHMVEVPNPRRPGQMVKEREQTMIDWADAVKGERAEQIKTSVYRLRSDARQDTSHADMMTKWAADIFDKKTPAYRNEDIDTAEWKVGDAVRMGGKTKKGWDAKIEAIADKDYTTRGYHGSRQTISVAHALLTRPAHTVKKYNYTTYKDEVVQVPASSDWYALRDIKRDATPLAKALKAAGLI